MAGTITTQIDLILPQRFNRILRYIPVGCDECHIFDFSLCDEHTVEGITVDEWERLNFVYVSKLY